MSTSLNLSNPAGFPGNNSLKGNRMNSWAVLGWQLVHIRKRRLRDDEKSSFTYVYGFV